MKKKFSVVFLSAFIVLNSCIFSFANPLILAKVAEVSLIYSIGRIGMSLLGFVGDVSDVIDLGNSVYSSLSDSEKGDFKENIDFNSEGFSYNDSVKDIIIPYLPSKDYHYLLGFERPADKPYIYDFENGYTMSQLNEVFNEYKTNRTYQSVTFEYMIVSLPYSSTQKSYTLCYRVKDSSSEDIKTYSLGLNRVGVLDNCIYSFICSNISNGNATFNLNIKGDSVNRSFKVATLSNTCSNCPHGDFDFKPDVNNSYPTESELEYIDKNYPTLENDIYDKIHNSNNGGSNGGGSNGGGSSSPGGGSSSPGGGGSSSPGGGSSSVVTPLPSFPNLPTLDFSGIDFESFGNMFDNVKSKFPFSIPFDIANILNLFKADPKAPIFEVPFVGTTFTIDLTVFTPLVNIISFFTVIGWVVLLITFTRKIGG